MTVDRVWHRCRLATLSPTRPGLGLVEDGLIAADAGKIVYAGPARDAPTGLDARQSIDCEGRWITPGLIDCHTHLVYGGDRAEEFELRLAGASYAEISRRGGGIASTVKATRLARVRTTFLGAHAMPPEMAGDKTAYIDAVCHQMLPALAKEGLADAVDAFCETIGFSAQETARVFTAAQELGLPIRLHADQLTNLHGAALAAKFGALAADHLEFTDEDGVMAMRAAGTVAVVLPGAFYFLREKQMPPIELMRRHGVPISISTDCNPGSSPLTSLLLTMNMGATLFRLTVDECIAAVTREAARALGLFDEAGSLDAGKRCDLAIWDIERPAELVYRMGFNPLHSRVWQGNPMERTS